MKRIYSGMVIALLVVLVLGSIAYARGGRNNYGMQLTGKTVEISGTIQAIDFTPPQIEIKVDVNGKIVEVELGPVKQYDSKDFQIGSNISLTGEYVSESGFIPYSLKVNQKTYDLRDANGRPLWVGQGNDGSPSQNSDPGCGNGECDCENCDQNRDRDRNRDCGGGGCGGSGQGMMGNRGSRNR